MESEVGYFVGAAPAQSDTVQNEKGQVWLISVEFGVFLAKALHPFSTSTLFSNLSACLHGCVKWCKINSESCQAKGRLKIKYIQSHYTVSVNMLEKICC